jgi:hypothetical protein
MRISHPSTTLVLALSPHKSLASFLRSKHRCRNGTHLPTWIQKQQHCPNQPGPEPSSDCDRNTHCQRRILLDGRRNRHWRLTRIAGPWPRIWQTAGHHGIRQNKTTARRESTTTTQSESLEDQVPQLQERHRGRRSKILVYVEFSCISGLRD